MTSSDDIPPGLVSRLEVDPETGDQVVRVYFDGALISSDPVPADEEEAAVEPAEPPPS